MEKIQERRKRKLIRRKGIKIEKDKRERKGKKQKVES